MLEVYCANTTDGRCLSQPRDINYNIKGHQLQASQKERGPRCLLTLFACIKFISHSFVRTSLAVGALHTKIQLLESQGMFCSTIQLRFYSLVSLPGQESMNKTKHNNNSKESRLSLVIKS